MKLVKATENDSDRLKEFFERMILPGSIDFSIRRPGSFFDQYRLQSTDFQTIMLIDDQDKINGIASLIFREGHVNGEKQIWGYATDLRVAPTRQAVMQWASRFLPVLESECEARRCKYVFSAVEHHGNQAYNALIRPTSSARRRLPRYYLVNRFRVVALHGRIPFAAQPLTSIRLKEMQREDIEPLCAYLREQAHERPLADVHDPELFMEKLSRWPGLELEDFRIARNAKGRILGCAALWDNSRAQQFVPQTYNGFAHTLHQSLNIASWFGLVRPTAQPERPMASRYLTHLACDSAEVFHRLVDDAFSRLAPKEFLVYEHFRGHWRTLPPLSFIASSLPFGLYMILPPAAPVPAWLTPHSQGLPPEFEAAWV